MSPALRRTAIGLTAAGAAWALAQAASACPVGKPVLAAGSPGVVIGSATDGGSLCRVRFSTGVELDYDLAVIRKATPADSREERPVPGASLPIAAAVRAGARLCRPGAEVIHQNRRATVMSVKSSGGERTCVLRMDGQPTLSLRSGDVEAPEHALLPADG